MKQGCRDLYVINYRFQGLAAKNCKTQKQCSQFRKSLGLDLKKIMGGAGLKRYNRSRGFSAKFARYRKVHDNYRIFQGLNCKKLHNTAMVVGGYCFGNSRQSRAREIARSRANERGRRVDSIPYLTYRGGASCGQILLEKRVPTVLPVLFLGGGVSARGWWRWLGTASRGGRGTAAGACQGA
jgi:hypothetical protein